MTWNETKAALLEALREDYQREVERFAEELRPRFEAGEIGDWVEDDPSPTDRLEELVSARFGLKVTKTPMENGGTWMGGDWAGAHLLIGLSRWSESMDGEWVHPGYHACCAVAQDVLDTAARHGWTTRCPETPYPFLQPPEPERSAP